jgi:tetratricopeptide (TPR) repeat protein
MGTKEENNMTAEEWLEKGVDLANREKYEEALKAFDKALEINPQFAEVLINRGIALNNLARYEEALEDFEKAMEINPDFAEAWTGKGVALYYLGRYKEALEAFEKAIEINPQYANAWYNKGITLDKLKKYEEALKAFEKAIEINPQYADAWNNKGVTLGHLKRYEDALKAFEKAIKIDPKNVVAWKNKGDALCKLEKYKDALTGYEKATKIKPNFVEALYNKGVALCKLEKCKDALKVFEKAIEIEPHFVEAWDGKGVALYNPRNASPYSNLGELYFDLDDLKNAYEIIEGALTINKSFAPALRLKGRIKIENKDYGSASKYFEEAIHSDSGDVKTLLWNAYAKYLKAEFSLNQKDKKYREEIAAIIRELERANELSKKQENNKLRAYILYFLGCFYYKTQDIFAAKEKLKECVSLKSKLQIKDCLKSKLQIKDTARELLDYIWNYAIRPSWWRWWLASPLNCWRRRIVFAFLQIAIFSLLLFHQFNPVCFPVISVNWSIYMILIALLIVFLFSPGIESIRVRDIEVKLQTPPSFEPVISPSMMENKIREFR